MAKRHRRLTRRPRSLGAPTLATLQLDQWNWKSAGATYTLGVAGGMLVAKTTDSNLLGWAAGIATSLFAGRALGLK